MTGYYTIDELKNLGVHTKGNDVRISVKTSIYSDSGGIEVGEHIRIDDFCVLVGNIKIGNYVHIASHCGLHASKEGRIVLEDYSGISSNVQIYASSDYYDGEYMTSRPGLSESMVRYEFDEIVLSRYSQIGTSSVVLPGGSLGEGTAVGAMSLVKHRLTPWGIYAGIPCRLLKERNHNFLQALEEGELI